MSDSPLKRKNENEDNQIVKKPNLDQKRFLTLFRVTNPNEIIQHLDTLGQDPEKTKILTQIFPEDLFPLLNPTIHCVRCHTSYDPDHNLKFKCFVPHHGEIETSQKDGTDRVTYTYTCCGQSFEAYPTDALEHADSTQGICQKTNHTSNVDYVENFVGCEECGLSGDEGDFEDDDDEDY